MQYDLIKEKIVLNRKLGHETTQVLMEGDIIVPDIMPDMAIILKTDAVFVVDKTDVSTDRISFSGRLVINALYLAKGSEKPVHNIAVVNGIDDFINMDGVTKDVWVDLATKVSNVDYKMQNDRKISYRAIIDVTVSAEALAECDVVTDISGLSENQQQKSVILINKTIDNTIEKFIVKGSLTLPSGKPNFSETLQSSVTIINKDIKISGGRVALSGDLLIATLYKSTEDTTLIDFCEHELPFNGVIDLPEAHEGMFSDVILTVNDQYIQVKQDEDGEERILDAEVSVFASLKLSHQTEVTVLEDAYCVDKDIRLKKEKIVYPKVVCRNKNQCPLKEVVSLESGCPDILQIFRVTGDVWVDEYTVIDDKVLVEGVVPADILYVAKNDNAPLYNKKCVIPFRQIIETKGAREMMKAEINTSVEHIGFNMLSDREVELRFLIGFNVKVCEDACASFIQDAEFCDLDAEYIAGIASMTIYVVQKSDTLWGIAKKYNTTIEDIACVNELEDAGRLQIGQRLLIIKN